MIGIVVLNPCVDKTLFLDELPREGIHTARKTTFLAGGNGNNVSRVLGALGDARRSLVVTAGETGAHIRRLMAGEGLPADFVEAPGLSRTVTTLVGRDFRQLAVKEPGPELGSGDLARIRAAFLEFLGSADLLCVATSVPCPGLAGFPAWAVREAKKRGIPALVDTSGPALALALADAPEYAKPNLVELTQAWKLPAGGSVDAGTLVRRMSAAGVRYPVLSLGREGALAGGPDGLVRVVPPDVPAVNPVGCGDSFVAGMLHGIIKGMPWTECLRWAAAAGAANAARWEAACLTRGEIEALLPRVTVVAWS